MDYKKRILKLKKMLKSEKLDAVLVSSIPNIIYFTGFSNFSKEEREAYLIITKKNAYILTDTRYSEAVEKEVPHCKILVRSPSEPNKKILKNLIIIDDIKTIGVETDNITVAEYTEFKKIFPSLHPCDISELREIKDTEEIELIQKACKIGDAAFEHVLGKIKPGITEIELAWEMEKYIRAHGATLSFDTIVAFGPHSSVPHHQTNNQSQLTNSSIVLFDFGVKYQNYCSDMTRTIFFGKATVEQKKMYETVRIAQEESIDLLFSVIPAEAGIHKNETGATSKLLDSRLHGNDTMDKGENHKSLIINRKSLLASDIDSTARDYIISQGFPSIPHSVGHGIGLEVHELPHISPSPAGGLKTKIKTGMVFSVEPGIYKPGFGGIRIEDLVAMTKNGPKLLTTASKNLIEL